MSGKPCVKQPRTSSPHSHIPGQGLYNSLDQHRPLLVLIMLANTFGSMPKLLW